LPTVKEKNNVGYLVWDIVFIRSLITIIFIFISVITFDIYSQKLGLGGYRFSFMIYQIAVLAQIGYFYFSLALKTRFMQKALFLIDICHQSLRIILVLYGILNNYAFEYFVISFTILWLLVYCFVVLYFSVKFSFPSLKKFYLKKFENREIIQYRRISYINEIGYSFLGTDIDRYILAYFSSTYQVAIYALATKIVKQLSILFPHKMLKSIIEPAFYSRYEETQNKNELNRMFRFIFNINTILGFLIITLFIAFGKKLLIVLFDQQYVTEAYIPIIIFLLFLILYGIPVGLIVKVLIQPKILLYSKIAVFVNIIIGIPLAINYGALGMALATAFSTALKVVFVYFLIKRNYPLVIPIKSFFKSMLIASITLFISFGLNTYTTNFLFCNILFTVIVYFLIMKLIPVLGIEDKSVLTSFFPKKFKFLKYSF
jgi:O-antigen/teichoic acid export membrane protein